jgi:hypothetical protein
MCLTNASVVAEVDFSENRAMEWSGFTEVGISVHGRRVKAVAMGDQLTPSPIPSN